MAILVSTWIKSFDASGSVTISISQNRLASFGAVERTEQESMYVMKHPAWQNGVGSCKRSKKAVHGARDLGFRLFIYSVQAREALSKKLRCRYGLVTVEAAVIPWPWISLDLSGKSLRADFQPCVIVFYCVEVLFSYLGLPVVAFTAETVPQLARSKSGSESTKWRRPTVSNVCILQGEWFPERIARVGLIWPNSVGSLSSLGIAC